MPEGRRYNFICSFIVMQFYFFQIRQHLLSGNFCSQKIVDLFRLKRNSYRLFFLTIYVHHTAHNFSGSQFFHQLAGAVDCYLCIIRIQSFFKFSRGIGTKSDSFGRQTDIWSIKAGSLKQYGVYIIGNHGVFSTHNTCDTHCFFSITDHQHILIHGALLSVQSHQLLIFCCPANHDLLSGDFIQIIGMHC